MIRLEINGKYYKIIDDYSVNKSSREVTFNSISIDFTGGAINDLPCKYQECHLVDCFLKEEEYNVKKTIFTGYVNTFRLPNMKRKDEYRKLEIELLSPMALATRRTISAIGTYKLEDLVEMILEPLFKDGFELIEKNITNHNVSVNYLVETVESSLNKLSNKYNFWWYIDENKGIYINDIDYQFSKQPKIIYDDKLKGLIEITPSLDATDYCNIVDLINTRVYSYSYDFNYTYRGNSWDLLKNPLFSKDITIKKGDTITFNYPVDAKPENILKSVGANGETEEFQWIIYKALQIDCTDTSGANMGFYVKTDSDGLNLQLSNNVEFDGEGNNDNPKTWSLIRDSFFSNLVVGVKYNGNNNIKNITRIGSCSSLIWTRMKFMNNTEIEKSKGKISRSGQIEKIIDMNETWHTLPELKDIANSYIAIKSSQGDEITLSLDKNHNLEVGDIIKIDKDYFFTQNTYIITDITETYINNLFTKYTVKLRNSNFLDNFVDLFRSKEEQEKDDKLYNLIVSDYEEDTISEVHEVV